MSSHGSKKRNEWSDIKTDKQKESMVRKVIASAVHVTCWWNDIDFDTLIDDVIIDRLIILLEEANKYAVILVNYTELALKQICFSTDVGTVDLISKNIEWVVASGTRLQGTGFSDRL